MKNLPPPTSAESIQASSTDSSCVVSNRSADLCIIGVGETAERLTQFCEYHGLFNIIAYAVDRARLKDRRFHSKPVFPIEDLENNIDKHSCLLYTAIFWNHLNGDRRRLYERLKIDGWKFANIISPLASIRGKMGENCWIMDYVVMQEESVIGDNVVLSDFVFVGDYTRIGNHCFFGARSTIMGSSYVGEQTFVGIGATIFDCVKIGKKCLVGACCVQKYDVPDFSVCKVLTENVEIKQYQEDIIENKWIAQHPNRINKKRE